MLRRCNLPSSSLLVSKVLVPSCPSSSILRTITSSTIFPQMTTTAVKSFSSSSLLSPTQPRFTRINLHQQQVLNNKNFNNNYNVTTADNNNNDDNMKDNYNSSTTTTTTATEISNSVDFRWAHTKETLQTLGNVTKNYTVTPYQSTGDAYEDMWAAVDNAKTYIIWHTYISKDDAIGQETIEKLRQAVLRGVKVEYLYDCGGNLTGRSKMVEPLKQVGATVIRYRPFFPQHLKYYRNFMTDWKISPGVRNHRKILVVDDEVGFTGGLNIGNEYAGTKVGGTGKFRDSHCKVTGVEGVKLLKAACEDTIRPEEDYALGRAWMKMLRWRQWAEMSVRFRRAANIGDENQSRRDLLNKNFFTAAAGGGGEDKQARRGKQQQQFKAFYEAQRAKLKRALSDDGKTSADAAAGPNQKLRTKLRERMKKAMSKTTNASTNNNNSKNISSVRVAWRKLKSRMERDGLLVTNNKQQQQQKDNNNKPSSPQQQQESSSLSNSSSSLSSSSRKERISSFLKARGKTLRKSASSLISLMEAKRKQLLLLSERKRNSDEARNNSNENDTGNPNHKTPLKNDTGDSSNNNKGTTTTAAVEDFQLSRREELAAKFQHIYVSRRDKIKESIALQQQLLATKKRKFLLSFRQKASQNFDENNEEIRLITPSELPVKSVVIDEKVIHQQEGEEESIKETSPSSKSSSQQQKQKPSTSSNDDDDYIVIACPDSTNTIHNLAINRKSDCFFQLLVCNPLTENFSLQMALWFVVRRAAARVWVTTPYFIPHRKLMNATIEAAKRGVDVRVLTGSRRTTDPWLMWYAQQYITHRLLKSGVRLYEYHGDVEHEENIYKKKTKKKNQTDDMKQNENENEEVKGDQKEAKAKDEEEDSSSTPVVKQTMHAKTVVIDGVWSSVGSYNWDILSNKLMEASVTTLDPAIAAEMEQHFENDLIKSEEIKEDTFLKRPFWVRVMCRVLYFGVKLTEYLSFRDYDHPDVTSRID